MKGDFSRNTFRRDKHYSGVLMQQGRVQLDADFNEQQAIVKHRVRAESADVVGQTGTPRDRPGFGITPKGRDLLIGAGRFYIDGVVCENEHDVLYSRQPDLQPVPKMRLPKTEGLYVAYLEAWERHITALEDADLSEPALGGPDTTTRTRLVWQVKLLRVDDPGPEATASTQFPEWDSLLQRHYPKPNRVGKLSARAQPTAASGDDACLLPPTAGYKRLENQLYRVEVHRTGSLETATFKWSRDNGTVVSTLEPDALGRVTNGSEAILAEVGKDDLLTFASDPLPQWVEVSDDRYELSSQHGELMRVKDVDPVTGTITFEETLPELEADKHPFARRWDQRGDGAPGTEPTADGVPMTGEWQELEDGVQVKFDPGRYKAGDYWLIPARTAIGGYSGGVVWPSDEGGPLPQPPDGTPHRLARLAVLRLEGDSFTLVPDGDARTTFPPLNAISAADVSVSSEVCGFDDGSGRPVTAQEAFDILCQRRGSLCTLLVGPGEDLAAAVESLGPNAPDERLDALICLRAGTYVLTKPLRFEGRGHIRLAGVGPGTRIEAPNSERVIEFVDCTSVKVSSLAVTAGVAGAGAGAKLGEVGPSVASGGSDNLGGALTFEDCPVVAVDDVVASCASGPVRMASCIAVRNRQHQAQKTTARVHDCVLNVGHLQVGVLLVNVARSRVTENQIRATTKPPVRELLANVHYRTRLRRALLSWVVDPGRDIIGSNVTITHGNFQVHARTDPRLITGDNYGNEWNRVLQQQDRSFTSTTDLVKWLRDFAQKMVDTKGTGEGGTERFRSVLGKLLAEDLPAASQGVTIGGMVADDIVISGNEIVDVQEGIHVGLGFHWMPGTAGVVTVRDNVIGVRAGTSATRDRLAVFVGNCDSLIMEANLATLALREGATTIPNQAKLVKKEVAARMPRLLRKYYLPVEGVRVCGTIGRRVIIRHNQFKKGFTTGVTFSPLNDPLPTQPLWLITENDMEGVWEKVWVPVAPTVEIEKPGIEVEIEKPGTPGVEVEIPVIEVKVPAVGGSQVLPVDPRAVKNKLHGIGTNFA